MENRKLRVGITHGDINGISYEVLLKALENPGMAEMCTPVVYGSAKIASFYRKNVKDMPEVKLTVIESAADADPAQARNYIINVVPEDTAVTPGDATKAGGNAALAALERATADLREGLIDVLVTCPINKNAIHGDDFEFPGHTEYLQARLGGENDKAMMIMASEDLRVALVTIHSPIAAVSGGITKDAVRDSIEAFGRSLVADFGIHSPRIAVLGLNPHAGERGINYTAGLPYVRTSPDHGTAYDIVCRGEADPQSLREAIYAAIDIYRNRQREAEATANPLRKQNFDRGSDRVPKEKKEKDTKEKPRKEPKEPREPKPRKEEAPKAPDATETTAAPADPSQE